MLLLPIPNRLAATAMSMRMRHFEKNKFVISFPVLIKKCEDHLVKALFLLAKNKGAAGV